MHITKQLQKHVRLSINFSIYGHWLHEKTKGKSVHRNLLNLYEEEGCQETFWKNNTWKKCSNLSHKYNLGDLGNAAWPSSVRKVGGRIYCPGKKCGIQRIKIKEDLQHIKLWCSHCEPSKLVTELFNAGTSPMVQIAHDDQVA